MKKNLKNEKGKTRKFDKIHDNNFNFYLKIKIIFIIIITIYIYNYNYNYNYHYHYFSTFEFCGAGRPFEFRI